MYLQERTCNKNLYSNTYCASDYAILYICYVCIVTITITTITIYITDIFSFKQLYNQIFVLTSKIMQRKNIEEL